MRMLELILVASLLLLTGCEKYALDRQMEELCKKDGGVKVYEIVTLPPEMFDQWGDPFPGWRQRVLQGRPEEMLGSEYRYVVETVYLKKGNPHQLFSEGVLRRYSEKIVRISDNKLLGESVVYGRTGGEVILLGHPSGSMCPTFKSAEEKLIRSVFLKKEG